MSLEFLNKLLSKIGVNIPWLSDPLNFDFDSIDPLLTLYSAMFILSGVALVGVINIICHPTTLPLFRT